MKYNLKKGENQQLPDFWFPSTVSQMPLKLTITISPLVLINLYLKHLSKKYEGGVCP